MLCMSSRRLLAVGFDFQGLIRRQEAANHAAGQPLGATIRVDGGSGEAGGLLDGVGGKGADSSRWWRPRANRVRSCSELGAAQALDIAPVVTTINLSLVAVTRTPGARPAERNDCGEPLVGCYKQCVPYVMPVVCHYRAAQRATRPWRRPTGHGRPGTPACSRPTSDSPTGEGNGSCFAARMYRHMSTVVFVTTWVVSEPRPLVACTYAC